MNKVILMGRLVKDPEVRYSPGAEPLAVARYTLAVDRKFQKKSENREADFPGCVAFGKSGEFAEKYFKKGQLVAVVGHLQTRSWDGDDGKKRWSTDVVVDEQYFCGSAKGESQSAAPEPAAPAAGAPNDGFYPVEPTGAAPAGWPAVQTSADDDDDKLPWE